MQKAKIAITAYEPVLYTEFYPIFEEAPFLIIVDEYNRIQKYSPEITAKGITRGKAEWIIGRGAKILVTGSIDDASYQKLKQAGIPVKWEAFGEVKSLVERGRRFVGFLIEMLEKEKHIVRTRFDRRARPRNIAPPYILPYLGNDPEYLKELEQKAKRAGKKRLLRPKDEEEIDEDDYESSGDFFMDEEDDDKLI
jgi:predicted Fe-Mo cluster-binding NifX family protein